MKFLFISKDGASLGVALRFTREGHDVRFLCATKEVGRGIVQRVETLYQGLEPDRVVIFDAPGRGQRADELRRSGYTVVGGSIFTDNVMLTPGYAGQLLHFSGVTEEVDLGGATLCADFNGQDWVAGSARMVYRDSRFMVGDVGPDVGMSTITVLYWRQLRPNVFKETLHKLTRILREASYIGPVEYVDHQHITLGVVYGLWDVSLGLCGNGSGKLFADLARGALQRYHPAYSYGLSAVVTLPPYPYGTVSERVHFTAPKDEWFHPYNVSDKGAGAVVGLVMAQDTSLKKAREVLNGRLADIPIANTQYRTDAGVRASNFREWVANARNSVHV